NGGTTRSPADSQARCTSGTADADSATVSNSPRSTYGRRVKPQASGNTSSAPCSHSYRKTTCCCPPRRVTPGPGDCTAGWDSSTCSATTASSATTARSPSSAAACRWTLVIEGCAQLGVYQAPAGVGFLYGEFLPHGIAIDI